MKKKGFMISSIVYPLLIFFVLLMGLILYNASNHQYRYKKAVDDMSDEINGETVVVTLDSDGGELSVSTKKVKIGSPYGELPVPIKEGYTFVNWSYETDTISEETIVTQKKAHTLKANYQKK